jgi:GAF domain-containing protein
MSADTQMAEISQALALSVCRTAGELFEELSTLTFSPLNRPAASLVLRAGLVTLNRMVSQNQSTDAKLKRVCDIMQRAFNFQRVSLYSVHAQSRSFLARAFSGKPHNVNAGAQCLQYIANETSVGEALLKNAHLYLRSPSDDGLGRAWVPWFRMFPDAKSLLLIPTVRENNLLGVIYADYSRSNVQGWTSEERELVEAISEVVCCALVKEHAA